MATPLPADLGAFRAVEHAGWQDTTPQYHHALGDLTSQAIRPLLDAVRAGKGMHLLDVATGPGYAAAAAAHRGSDAIGIDFSAAMVAQARRLHPTVEFREGNAEVLPLPDESFDAVVMNFGLLHLPHPEPALGEAHRVLRHGGRVGFTVWARPEEAVSFHIVLRAIETHGNLNVPLPPGPPFFRFSDPDESHRVLLEGGFVTPRVNQVPQVWRLDSPYALYEAILKATVRTGALLRAQSHEALTAIRTTMRDAARAYAREGIIALPMPAVLASAVKP